MRGLARATSRGLRLDLARLPNDPTLLQRVVRDLADVRQRRDAELAETKARLADRDTEIEKLQLFLSELKRQRFGRSSEKCHPDQLEPEALVEAVSRVRRSGFRQSDAFTPFPLKG